MEKEERYFELMSSTTIPLTKELVAEFAKMEPSPTERGLHRPRLIDLKEKFDNGLTVPFLWATAECNGKQYRINGQHSVTVLKQANGKFPEGVTVHRDHYKCETEDGLIMLFRQHDPRGSGRSPGDVAGTYQGFEPDLINVPRPLAKQAIEGVAWYLKEVEGLAPRKGDDRYGYFHNDQYHPFLHWVAGIFSVKTPELRRVQILSAMFGTWNANQEEAETFWDEVARGGDASSEDAPTSKLDAWLKATQAKEVKVKPAPLYQGCIFVWNAYRRGDTSLRQVKADMSKGFHDIAE